MCARVRERERGWGGYEYKHTEFFENLSERRRGYVGAQIEGDEGSLIIAIGEAGGDRGDELGPQDSAGDEAASRLRR